MIVSFFLFYFQKKNLCMRILKTGGRPNPTWAFYFQHFQKKIFTFNFVKSRFFFLVIFWFWKKFNSKLFFILLSTFFSIHEIFVNEGHAKSSKNAELKKWTKIKKWQKKKFCKFFAKIFPNFQIINFMKCFMKYYKNIFS